MTKNEYRRRLSAAKVGIAGAGGLGSTCAMALARAGVGHLVVADFDLVSPDNLDRQQYFSDQVGEPKVLALKENIGRIDQSIRVDAELVRIDPGNAGTIFRDCPVVVEALDLAEAKEMLIETLLADPAGPTVVAGSGLGGYGRAGRIRTAGEGRLYVVGDQESGVGPDLPPMAPIVGVVACMQADIVISLLLDRG